MPHPAYATPTDDQIAWRDSVPVPGLLPAHLVAFVQCGVGMTLGARAADGRPVLGAGVGCRVQDMALLRVLMPRSLNLDLVEAVAQGSAVAATFSRVRDHRSIQIKAASAEVREPVEGDVSEAARQSALLADELVELGYTRFQAEVYAYCGSADLLSLEFRPERIFTQTPGPGAGAELPR